MKIATLLSLVSAGMIAHFLWVLAKLEEAGTILSPITYYRSHPYKVTAAIVGGYLLALVFYFMNQLNEVVAIGTGVMCSEAMDMLRARAAGRMRDALGPDAPLDDGGQKS
jgi:hypothetical protein